MWLLGCPNPYKMEQSWECTFLRLFTHTNPKSASKIIFIIGLKNYYLSSTANTALVGRIGSACLQVSLKSNDIICFWCWFCIFMGKESQKSVFPTLFHFGRVRADFQPHVSSFLYQLTLVEKIILSPAKDYIIIYTCYFQIYFTVRKSRMFPFQL